MPKAKTETAAKKSVKLTVTQQQAEKWLNDQEDQGKFLLTMGLISQEVYDKGHAELVDLTIKVEGSDAVAQEVLADPNAAIQKYEDSTGMLGGDAVEAVADADSYDHELDSDDDFEAFLTALAGDDVDGDE